MKRSLGKRLTVDSSVLQILLHALKNNLLAFIQPMTYLEECPDLIKE